MEGSDDYLFDDLVLDEATVAILDKEENKYIEKTRSISQHPAPQPSLPPPKRQKTYHYAWNQQPSATFEAQALPEISIQDDGTYGLSSTPRATPGERRPSGGVQNRSTSVQIPVSKPVSASNRSRNMTPRVSNYGQPQVAKGASAVVSNNRQPSASGSGSGSSSQSRTSRAGLSASSARTVSIPVQTRPVTVDAETAVLRAQLEQLKEAQQQMQKQLDDAVNVRYTKEGEVTILRKTMEKTAQEHAAEIAKFRTAKEAAEAARLQAQKEAREEIERLKTQFTFKHHELETSTRKSPWSVRTRVTKQPPPTPTRVPTQIREWNGPSSSAPTEAPHDARPNAAPSSPLRDRSRKRSLGNSPKKPPKLPGFFNSFEPSQPKAAPQRNGKGKEHLRPMEPPEADVFSANYSQDHNIFQSSPPTSPIRMGPPAKSSVLIADSDESHMDVDVDPDSGRHSDDVNMADDTKVDAPAEEIELEPIDWRVELHRIVFSHTFPPCKSGTMQSGTMQMLMSNSLPASASEESTETYNGACARLLGILGSTFGLDDWDSVVRTVSESLATMASILNSTKSFLPLTAVLNLARVLACCVPSMASSLLLLPLSPEDVENSPPRILAILSDIIQDNFDPNNRDDSHWADLATETIGFLQALSWNIPQELTLRFSALLQNAQTLATLLKDSQPTWLLHRVTRALTMLATHPTLYHHLLIIPDTNIPEGSKLEGQVPYIEQLCLYLVDSNRRGPEAVSLRNAIFTFISTLSISHTDVLIILAKSRSLIPALVVSLTHLTAPLWEEDGRSAEAQALLESATQTLDDVNRIMSLLYYLVLSPSSACDLRHKLANAPHRMFHGAAQMGLVTLGRLGYAEPPEWLGTMGQQLEQTSDMAKELLDLIIDGPEVEMVWAAYHEETNEASVTLEDDEEKEARLLHPIGLDE